MFLNGVTQRDAAPPRIEKRVKLPAVDRFSRLAPSCPLSPCTFAFLHMAYLPRKPL
jgi:hypothetical protein